MFAYNVNWAKFYLYRKVVNLLIKAGKAQFNLKKSKLDLGV